MANELRVQKETAKASQHTHVYVYVSGIGKAGRRTAAAVPHPGAHGLVQLSLQDAYLILNTAVYKTHDSTPEFIHLDSIRADPASRKVSRNATTNK